MHEQVEFQETAIWAVQTSWFKALPMYYWRCSLFFVLYYCYSCSTSNRPCLPKMLINPRLLDYTCSPCHWDRSGMSDEAAIPPEHLFCCYMMYCFSVNWKSWRVIELFCSVVKTLEKKGLGMVVLREDVCGRPSARENVSFPYQPAFMCWFLKQAAWRRGLARRCHAPHSQLCCWGWLSWAGAVLGAAESLQHWGWTTEACRCCHSRQRTIPCQQAAVLNSNNFQ